MVSERLHRQAQPLRTPQWSSRSPVWLTGDCGLCCAPQGSSRTIATDETQGTSRRDQRTRPCRPSRTPRVRCQLAGPDRVQHTLGSSDGSDHVLGVGLRVRRDARENHSIPYVAASPRRPTRSHKHRGTAPGRRGAILSLRCGPYVQGAKCRADGGVESDRSESGIRQGCSLGRGLCDEAEQREVPDAVMADVQVGLES